MSIKIAIVGAGWFGCHIAMKLKKYYDVSLFDANGIFTGSSIKNQNRLHLGFHYARSSSTRILCEKTFDRFNSEYGHLTVSLPLNIYAIPERNSLIDFNTYTKIFDNYSFDIVSPDYLKNVSGAINVDEKYINPFFAQAYFISCLKNIFELKYINNLDELSNHYDLVINCTNNLLNPIVKKSFMEPCTILLYEKISNPEFDALTFVDGPLFSIFPFYKNLVTVSDVEHTPNSTLSISSKLYLIEQKISYYYSSFHKNFKYIDHLEAIKAKPIDVSDSRVPVITMENNIINCFSGKIQGIYYLEDYVRNLCEF